MTHIIIKYRWWIIGLCLLIGAGFASMIPLAKTDPEIRNYIPETMPSKIRTDEIEKVFGVQDMVIVLFSDSNIISTDDLNQIKRIDHGMAKLSGVSDRISPFTVKTIRGEEGMMIADPLIKSIPADSSGVAGLRHFIASNTLAGSVVFSPDQTTAAITATINNSGSEIVTLDKIDSVISINEGSARVQTGGLPYIRKYIMKDVRKDALIIIPAALLIMLLILKLTLGKWRRVFMPFTVVVLSTAVSMGLIPLLGWKISILSLLVPIILVAVANNYGIYLVARHQEIGLGWNGSGREIIHSLLGSLNMPILFSGLTTIAGILGLLTHSIIPARQIGILAASGVTIALLMSLLFIPALLYSRNSVISGNAAPEYRTVWFGKVLQWLSSFIIRKPKSILVGAAGVTVLLSLGMLFLRIDTNQENYFPKSHPIRSASNIINTKFGGSQTISVMISGDIKDPGVMTKIDELTTDIEGREGVGKVFSISQVIREMSKAIYSPEEAEYDRIPATREGIAQLFELYNMSSDQGDFDQLMDPENTKAHVLIRLSDPTNRVVNNIENLIKASTADIKADIIVGGYAIIMSDFAESIIRGQVYSLIFAVVTVLLLLAVIFRSFRGGLTGTIPLAASILILFGFMGFTGIALDAATALLSSIMIGVGVDFTIQYMWCFNAQLRKGLDYEEATVNAIKTIGRSIIINAFSVMAGFSALMFSGFTSIRFFGYLVFISIGSCLIGAILIIPAFLIMFRPKFIEKDLSSRKRIKHEKSTDIIPVPTAAFTGSRATA